MINIAFKIVSLNKNDKNETVYNTDVSSLTTVK